MKSWLWAVFTQLGKRRGSICPANCFNISGDTTTASSYFKSSGDFFLLWFFLQERGRNEIYGACGASAQHPTLGLLGGESLIALKRLGEGVFLHSRSEVRINR